VQMAASQEGLSCMELVTIKLFTGEGRRTTLLVSQLGCQEKRTNS
jgi:hypothetical protein